MTGPLRHVGHTDGPAVGDGARTPRGVQSKFIVIDLTGKYDRYCHDGSRFVDGAQHAEMRYPLARRQAKATDWTTELTKLPLPARVIAEKTVTILLVRGESPDGEPIYAYVAVRADKLEDFMAAQETGTFYPEDFGVVIEAGEGYPAEEVRKKMEDEYGFNHEAMTDIPTAEQAHEIVANLRAKSESGQ
jgi:hypothetical protein